MSGGASEINKDISKFENESTKVKNLKFNEDFNKKETIIKEDYKEKRDDQKQFDNSYTNPSTFIILPFEKND
jgi:hypothetical protein